jgi:hypothetical protein
MVFRNYTDRVMIISQEKMFDAYGIRNKFKKKNKNILLI